MLLGLMLVLAWPLFSTAPPAAPSAEKQNLRIDALARARVLRDEPFKASEIDFSTDPNTGLIDPHLTICTFVPTEPTGTTPKFDCKLDSGKQIKVKYGWTREIPAEVAAARLVYALGFPANHMSRVATVRCYGCVVSPFHVRLVARMLHMEGPFDRHLNYNHAIDFVNVSVERRFKGHGIDEGQDKGWSFYELSTIDPSRGGATRAEVDALRLMAVFLGHWDNKVSNQRLLCEDNVKHEPCEHPLAMIHDLGSSFGPYKLNLDGWMKAPVWAETNSCTVSMKSLPFNGGTFPEVRISEEGRCLLGDRLKQLSRAQITMLFSSAGFADVDRWVSAFQDKVRQIVDRNACPA